MDHFGIYFHFWKPYLRYMRTRGQILLTLVRLYWHWHVSLCLEADGLKLFRICEGCPHFAISSWTTIDTI